MVCCLAKVLDLTKQECAFVHIGSKICCDFIITFTETKGFVTSCMQVTALSLKLNNPGGSKGGDGWKLKLYDQTLFKNALSRDFSCYIWRCRFLSLEMKLSARIQVLSSKLTVFITAFMLQYSFYPKHNYMALMHGGFTFHTHTSLFNKKNDNVSWVVSKYGI